ncbi:TolC family protein [Octadecabacter sp. G9-8]|uniref:TolC family protein n=2 Tax=Octadecabacter dasysiphoniae TaxID=2909341 RepID=A0ABS9CZG5_9RHOB|nr:TolC family protein [Octadecabacter dasysiphoniae]
MSSPVTAGEAATVAETQAGLRGAEGAFRPVISVGADADSSSSTGLGNVDVSPVLELTQLVYDGGVSRSRIVEARASVDRSIGTRIVSTSATTLTAVETYLSVVMQRKLFIAASDTVAALESLQDRIDERAEAGAGIQTDILAARSALADATARQVAARAELQQAEAAYAEVFDHHPPPDLPAPVSAPLLSNDMLEDLTRTSPRLRTANANIAAFEAGLDAVRAGRSPQVSLEATAEPDFGGDSDIGLGLSVDYPLYSQGRLTAAIDAAEAQLSAAIAERAALERALARALANVISERETGAARVAAAQNALDANAATLEAAREQFQIGRRSLLELLDAELDTFEANQVLISAQNDRALTGWAALALTGDILAVFDISLSQERPTP